MSEFESVLKQMLPRSLGKWKKNKVIEISSTKITVIV